MSQSRYESSRIDVEKELWFSVHVDFDVLVIQTFVFEGDPDAVDEGAEAASVQFEVVICGVGVRGFESFAGGLFVVGFFGGVAALVWVEVLFGAVG